VSPELVDDMHAFTGTESAVASDQDSGSGSEDVMNEELGMCYDGLGYETRCDMRRHNQLRHGI
jgi:hypothetical protein